MRLKMPIGVEFQGGVDPDPAEKRMVVADDEQRTAVVVQGLRELFDASDVEIVGRLIQDQQLCGWVPACGPRWLRAPDAGHPARRSGDSMSDSVLRVDWTRCDGHGLCAALLASRITLDEWGFPVIDPGELHGQELHEARAAALACPALALRVERSPH